MVYETISYEGSRMRYVDCTYPEIAAHADNGWLALVPMGCTEQQGPHLGVGRRNSDPPQPCQLVSPSR